MNDRISAALLGTILFSLSACGSNEARVRARAASDFACAEKDVQVSVTGEDAFGAKGCGKEGQYVCHETTLSGIACERTSGSGVKPTK